MESPGLNVSDTWSDLPKKRKLKSNSRPNLEPSEPGTSGTSSFEVKVKKVEDLKSEVGKTFQSLKDLLECAVCYNTLPRDTLLCVNGHSICIGCKRDQEVCPTCREEFSNVKNNLLVRQVLELLPHLCKHKGCSHVVKPGDDHEVFCCLRLIVCHHTNCLWEGPVEDLRHHIETEHFNKFFPENSPNMGINNFDPNKYSRTTVLFSAFGHFFWQIMENDPRRGLLAFSLFSVFSFKPTHNFFVNISLNSDYVVNSKIRLDSTANKDIVVIPTARVCDCWDPDTKVLKFGHRVNMQREIEAEPYCD